MARRGYDRDQVDQHLTDLGERLAAATQSRQAAEQRVRTLEQELRSARERGDSEPAMSQDSFGFRAEKILRFAEHEAADVRTRAATVLEQARADAEKHRHEVEQALIARSAELDAEAAKRTIAIQEREQQAQMMLAGAREEAEHITDEAQRNAEKTVTDAQNRSEQVRKRTEQECRRRREAAEQELRRIAQLRDTVRSDILRLHTLLGAEVPATPLDTSSTSTSSGTSVPSLSGGSVTLAAVPTTGGTSKPATALGSSARSVTAVPNPAREHAAN